MLRRNQIDAPDLSLDEAFNEAFSCFEILRTVGFTPEELYFAANIYDGYGTVIRFVVRQYDVPHDFVIDIAVVPEQHDAVIKAWSEAVVQHNGRDEAAGRAWVLNVRERSRIRARAVELLAALERKGFTVGRVLQ